MDLHRFFKNEVKPALGCTEPGAVAFAAAVAARELDAEAERICVRSSVNLFKNGRSVGLPGVDGIRGNAMAAALGAVGGDPDFGLTALSQISATALQRAREIFERGGVSEIVEQDAPSVWAEVTLYAAGRTSACTIAGRHDRVACITVDGQNIFKAAEMADDTPDDPREQLKQLDFEDIWQLSGEIDDLLEARMLEGVEMNMAIAEQGISSTAGLKFGSVPALDRERAGLIGLITCMTGAASDLRMTGACMPVMSSSGSGNHGLTAIIPLAIVAGDQGSSSRELAEAVALSHMVCGYLKAYIGRLTPTCGCAVAAGAGAAAGIVRLLQGTAIQAERAVSTFVAALLGMVCDGAKESCGLKVSTAAAQAYTTAMLVLSGGGIHDTQGLVPVKLPELVKVLEPFNHCALAGTDSGIVELLLKLPVAG
ncbi:UPF0597 protein [Desulfosarcina alkanivorans]|jgi:L-cysteine desulfidase|uniref:UPF0597 protein DSCA_02090 n=1 Tax=Desulfosarcina alkanivorans TaxID=571177 RepID=A0A5K7YEW8_9BACT|nr:L-serine ammonia-lyase, iron-sulfur-dependent, subunit alpha [Desulfosarcina alkanivorans]BBO66279.1 UPF0597 protein [Desulfosarcina alkanivorans]